MSACRTPDRHTYGGHAAVAEEPDQSINDRGLSMREELRRTARPFRRLSGAVVIASALTAGAALGAEGIDPKAEGVLKSMSAYMATVKAFSVNTDIDFEILTKEHQKIQFSSFATAVVERPGRLHIERAGEFADSEIYFDGKTLTLYGKNLNVYAQLDAPGTIDDAIRAYEWRTGIPAPGADLLFNDPYKVLMEGVEKATYVGSTQVDGVECHHLAFRKDEVDWQLWVQTGDRPLPMKYVITSKWQAAAPQYAIRYRGWNTQPSIGAKQFTFVPPAGATRLDKLTLDELGEFSPEQGCRK
jgi:hypothetical protein